MRSHLDWLLILPVILLMLFGLTILRSITPQLVTQQALIMLVSLCLAGLIATVPYSLWRHFSWVFYFLALALLITTFILGQTTRGSVRWISLGQFRLQTSEIAKPLLVIFFADWLARRDLTKLHTVLVSTLLFALPALLIFRQPDLGSTLVVVALWLGMMFVSGTSAKYFLLGISLTLAGLPLVWHWLKDYQRERLINFINPLHDPLKDGYHLLQSIIAVGSGRIFGRGLGQGTQSQLRFLPESHTDFIFATLAEELGFFGSLLLVGLFAALFIRLFILSRQAADRFGYLLICGVLSMLMFQVFINVGMNIGLVPITGITLPLISFGGSSVLATLISLGLVAAVAARSKPKDAFEIH